MSKITRLAIGDKAPEFTLQANGNQTVSLSDFKGQYVVLFFYPKDDTSGCTKECIGFSEQLSVFKDLNCVVIGLSKDSAESHDKFIQKYNLTIPLLSDPDIETIKAYGSWVEKSMYGKKYMGVDRSSFIIDPYGVVTDIYRKVKVPGHVDKVLKRVKELTSQSA